MRADGLLFHSLCCWRSPIYTQRLRGDSFDEEAQARQSRISWWEVDIQSFICTLHWTLWESRILFIQSIQWTTWLRVSIWNIGSDSHLILCSRVHVNLVSCSQASSHFLYVWLYIYFLVLTAELQALCILFYWCSIEKKTVLWSSSGFNVWHTAYTVCTLHENGEKKWMFSRRILVSSQGWEGKW